MVLGGGFAGLGGTRRWFWGLERCQAGSFKYFLIFSIQTLIMSQKLQVFGCFLAVLYRKLHVLGIFFSFINYPVHDPVPCLSVPVPGFLARIPTMS